MVCLLGREWNSLAKTNFWIRANHLIAIVTSLPTSSDSPALAEKFQSQPEKYPRVATIFKMYESHAVSNFSARTLNLWNCGASLSSDPASKCRFDAWAFAYRRKKENEKREREREKQIRGSGITRETQIRFADKLCLEIFTLLMELLMLCRDTHVFHREQVVATSNMTNGSAQWNDTVASRISSNVF